MLYLVTEKGPIFIVNVGDHLTLNKILVSAQRKNSTSKNKQTKVSEGRCSECELMREMYLIK